MGGSFSTDGGPLGCQVLIIIILLCKINITVSRTIHPPQPSTNLVPLLTERMYSLPYKTVPVA